MNEYIYKFKNGRVAHLFSAYRDENMEVQYNTQFKTYFKLRRVDIDNCKLYFDEVDPDCVYNNCSENSETPSQLDSLSKEELLNVINAYSDYIMDNAEENPEFGKSWYPCCIEEFFDNEYQMLEEEYEDDECM